VDGLITLSPQQFARFAAFIYERTGIRTADGKVMLLSNRIRRRLRARGLDSFDTYYELLQADRTGAELEAFVDVITTNETHFFRTPAHFDWVAGPFLDELIAAAAARRRDRTLRIWSAACSTGEEAYSLAICLTEQAGRLAGWRLSVLGTDLCGEALAAARVGAYGPRAVEAVSPERLARHFAADPAAGTWKIRPPAARLCEFRRHNLLDPMPGPPFSLVVVRNVLIYFDRESKRAALANLVAAVEPGGYLLVGTTDGASEHLSGLERCSTFTYRKP
jgi:chemotaxis protein methyltransferase CheR